MKKKTKSIIAMGLACTMLAGALSGCGGQAEAMNQQGGDKTSAMADSSTPSGSEVVGSKSTETVGGTEEAGTGAFEGAENEDIVLYAEKGTQFAVPFDGCNFVADTGKVVATEDIEICDSQGYIVGYIKNGATINVDEIATDVTWSRFENPITGTEYDYLYVMNSYLINEDIVILTADEATSMIIDRLHQRSFDMPTILDAPTDDMEVHEFVLPKENESELELARALTRAINDENLLNTLSYMTYYVECEEGTNVITCKLYYKDLYDK